MSELASATARVACGSGVAGVADRVVAELARPLPRVDGAGASAVVFFARLDTFSSLPSLRALFWFDVCVPRASLSCFMKLGGFFASSSPRVTMGGSALGARGGVSDAARFARRFFVDGCDP